MDLLITVEDFEIRLSHIKIDKLTVFILSTLNFYTSTKDYEGVSPSQLS